MTPAGPQPSGRLGQAEILRPGPDGTYRPVGVYEPVLDSEDRQRLEEFERLARLLDSQFRLPGTNWRFGVEALIGLVPGIGDVGTGLVSAYLIWRAHQIGIPTGIKARMIGNVVVDSLVGSIPLLGSIFDFAFKANNRNLRLLRSHLERRLQSRDSGAGPY